MHEVLDVANAFGTTLKIAWVVWLAWGIGQVFWYRFERASAAAPKLPSGVRVPRRTAPRPVDTPSVQPVAARLITPPHVETLPNVEKPQEIAAARPVDEPRAETPVFDPLKAVVETFDSRDHSSLDAIVADMERHLSPRDVSSRIH